MTAYCGVESTLQLQHIVFLRLHHHHFTLVANPPLGVAPTEEVMRSRFAART